ncbi:DUF397 domain-containing protein [Actinomadura viridis]|uniref:DUF397 domain-containing protein n=1 Tax=Actinomadura viridis TaxID=58110 RepID=UPI0036CF70AC
MTGPTWRKSSHSGTQEDACVELADLTTGIGVRDSKAPNAGHLTLTPHAFTHLINQIKRDRPSS